MDSEHIVIEAPTSSGSELFSFKRTFSFALFDIVDVTYKFLYVNVGSKVAYLMGAYLEALLFTS
jgi:hypothetical protein